MDDAFSRAIAEAEESVKYKREEGGLGRSMHESDFSDEDNLALREAASNQMPKDMKELYRYVQICYGIDIPYISCAPGERDAPIAWFYDLFFNKNKNTIGMAPRRSGKTWMGSMLANSKCSLLPRYEIIHAAASQDQASVAQGYLNDFANDEVWGPKFQRGEVYKKSATWLNRSSWNIATGSMKGISGRHPATLSLDEVEFWEMDAIEQTWAVPVDKNGHKAQWMAFSTRQRSYSTMNTLVNQAMDPNTKLKLYQWSVLEVMKPCASCLCVKGGQVVSNPQAACSLWEDCRGIVADPKHRPAGFISREDVCELKSTMSDESWQTQFLCKRPSTEGLVLPNFIHKYSVPANVNLGNYTIWKYDKDLPVYAVHDPGEGKKSCLFLFQVYSGRLMFFDEIIIPNSHTVGGVKKELYNLVIEKGYAFPKIIVVDPRRTDAGAVWEEGRPNGIGMDRSYVVNYPDIDGNKGLIEVGLELLRRFVKDGDGTRSLFVNPMQCPGGITAVREHHYKEGKTGVLSTVEVQKPSPAYKDEIDCFRYAAMWATDNGLHNMQMLAAWV